jgi:RNA polymerase sigma-70 factor (ECF subfamily)
VNARDLRSDLEQLHAASFGWALHCCRNRRELAEDLLQDVYMRVLAGQARFAGRSAFKTWLFGVIRTTAREQSRTRWLRAALSERWQRGELDSGHAPDPETMTGDSQRSAWLRAAVAALPRRQQEVLHLVYYQDLTIEDSAQLLGISIGSARTHFDRGKRSLRERLQAGES